MRKTSAAALALVLASVTTVVTVPALAHLSLDAPKGRSWQTGAMQTDQGEQKTAPCGAAGTDVRTTNASLITTYQPGETVTIKFRETVQHPGHFEISFDSDGQDFPFPGEAPSATSGVTVLATNIPDKSSADYTYEVTLPNMECEKCTLQLVQVMTTKSPPYAKTGDLYFQCADIVLKAGGGGGSGGVSAGGASSAGMAGASSRGGSGGGGASASGGTAMGGSTNGGTATGGSSSSVGGAATGGVATGGSSSSTGGAATGGANSSTGGANSSTGGANSSTGGASNSTGGASSSTGGATAPPAAGSTSSPGTGEEPGCAMSRSPGSGAGLSLLALSALLGWQRRRRGTALARRH